MKYTKELHDFWKAHAQGNGWKFVSFYDVQESITALLDEIDRLNAERRWIPVGERLPEVDGKYRVYRIGDDGAYPDIALWSMHRWGYGDYFAGEKMEQETITHWMPLPPPPQEGE